ncbi:MAG: Gldg family protein [Verrucomicrobiales bacterium]
MSADAFEPVVPPKKVRLPRASLAFHVTAQCVLLGLILLAINYLSFQYYKRWDVSRDARQQLTPQTKNLLNRLDQEVRFIVLFQPGNILAAEIENLIKEYQHASDRMIRVEYVSPFLNHSRALELQTRYGFQLNEDGVVVATDQAHKFIRAHQMAEFDTSGLAMGQRPQITAFLGESAISSAILEVTEQEKPVVYFIEGHGESAPPPQGTAGMFFQRLAQQNIELRPLNLYDVDAIPADASAVLVAGPKYDLTEREVTQLQAYWAQNGRIFALTWTGGATVNYDAFLSWIGLTPRADQLVALRQDALTRRVVRDVIAIPVNDEHQITRRFRGLNVLLQGLTQSIHLAEAPAGTEIVPLLAAAEGYWGEVDWEIDQTPSFEEGRDFGPPLVLAASVERGGMGDGRLEMRSARLFLVGNAFAIEDQGITDSSLDFLASGMNWLLNRGDLIGIGPKPARVYAPRLDEDQLRRIATVCVVAFPSAAVVLGLLMFWIRRR